MGFAIDQNSQPRLTTLPVLPINRPSRVVIEHNQLRENLGTADGITMQDRSFMRSGNPSLEATIATTS